MYCRLFIYINAQATVHERLFNLQCLVFGTGIKNGIQIGTGNGIGIGTET